MSDLFSFNIANNINSSVTSEASGLVRSAESEISQLLSSLPLGNLLVSLFGSLTNSFNDQTRPLRIRFPTAYAQLNDSLMLQRITGHAALCDDFDFDLLCVASTIEIPLKLFIALPVAVEVITDQGEMHHIYGIITEARAGSSDGGLAAFRLRLQSGLSLLSRRRNSRVFVNKSILDITYSLLDEWKAKSSVFASVLQLDTSRITKDYPVKAFTYQFDEDDQAFLSRLWRKWGISWFIEPLSDVEGGAITHRLVLFDDAERLDQNPTAGTIQFQRESATETRDTITNFGGARTLVPGSVYVQQWQPTIADVQTSNIYTHRDQGRNGSGMVAVLEDSVYDTTATGLEPSQMDRFGLLQIERKEYAAKCFYGEGNVRDLSVGQWFTLDGHPELASHEGLGADFVVTELWIEAENNLPKPIHQRMSNVFEASGWESSLVEQSKSTSSFTPSSPTRFRNRFKAIRKGIPIVPAYDAKLDLPNVHSVVGIVVTPKGQEVHCDEWGRVQIFFPNSKKGDHPDAGANQRDGDSAWVDLLSPWAGDQFGAMNLPRSGDSVVIDFLNNDPDRPYVSGRLYQAQRMPPTFSNTGSLPDNKFISGIKSKEIQSNRYNQLRFDDTPSQISAQLASQEGDSQLNLGFLTQPRAADGKGDPRGNGFELRTDGHGSIRAAKGLFIGTDAQANASGKQLDIHEAIQQLEQALEQVKALQKAATQAKADPKDGYTRYPSLKQQLDDQLKTMAKPNMLISTPAGIAVTTPKSHSYSAGESITMVANKQIDLNSMGQLTAAAASGMSLYTQLGGFKAIANQGQVQIQSQNDALQVAALKDMTITSSQGMVTIAAKNGLMLACGNGYIKINTDGSIELGSPSVVNVKSQAFNTLGAASFTPVFPDLPTISNDNSDKQYFQVLVNGVKDHGLKYKVVDKGGNVIQESTFNTKGKTNVIAQEHNLDDLSVVLDSSSELDEMRKKFLQQIELKGDI